MGWRGVSGEEGEVEWMLDRRKLEMCAVREFANRLEVLMLCSLQRTQPCVYTPRF